MVDSKETSYLGKGTSTRCLARERKANIYFIVSELERAANTLPKRALALAAGGQAPLPKLYDELAKSARISPGGAIRGRKLPHRGDDTMLMFALGFVLAILLNAGIGWLVVAMETADDPLPS
jgi:hypothetical protein